MTIQRRGFLASILATGLAPAVVGSGILMPVRRIARPLLWWPGPARTLTLPEWGDSVSYMPGDVVSFVNDGGRELIVAGGKDGKIAVRAAYMVTAVKRSDGWHIEAAGLS